MLRRCQTIRFTSYFHARNQAIIRPFVQCFYSVLNPEGPGPFAAGGAFRGRWARRVFADQGRRRWARRLASKSRLVVVGAWVGLGEDASGACAGGAGSAVGEEAPAGSAIEETGFWG